MYAQGTESLSQRTRDAIWAHVCAEVDIRFRKDNPDASAILQSDAAASDDPEVEQAFTAWYGHRINGGTTPFAEWRREWLATQEAKDGTHA